MKLRTQVGIVGAGPAGLILSHLLHLAGIESIVVEARSRDYCESRVRAGLLEQWSTDLLIDSGLGERLQREGMVHGGLYFAFNGRSHHFDFHSLVGRGMTIYAQQEVVKDAIAARLAAGGQILFEVAETALSGCDTERPSIRLRHEDEEVEIDCEFIAGCDGFHGVSRPAIPAHLKTEYDQHYPFAWLGIISASPPPEPELIYTHHERGFALFTMRSPTLSRLYLQCDPDDDVDNWSDDRIWRELQTRLPEGHRLTEGEILQKGITPMRSFVTEPMQHGRLFLAGDAAHIVPPTGAKGMNLALADVRVLAEALAGFYRTGSRERLDAYSATVLPRVWKAQRFSWWMTTLLHSIPGDAGFNRRIQLAELEYLVNSQAAMRTVAENYSGLPFD